MANSFFYGQTLDDVMRNLINEIIENGIIIKPGKGNCLELIGVIIEINNPRARLSRTEIKGTPFSCLGELCWYLAKRNDLSFIKYYIEDYIKSADEDIIFGGYGPRLFNWKGVNQFNQVISFLKKNDSRKAVIQLFDATDLQEPHRDVPCTCFLQFLNRNNKLHLITYMRSNDVYKGLPHDIFCFTMIQEIIARIMSLELGRYKHIVGSIHLYEKDIEKAKMFLGEGWQPTNIQMPALPNGDPTKDIDKLLVAENDLRTKGRHEIDLTCMDSYWADLIRLLTIFRSWKDRNKEEILKIRETMSSNFYNTFINKKINQIELDIKRESKIG